MINRLILILFLIISIFVNSIALANDNVITVYYEKEIGTINKKVFGNNFQGLDPRYHKYPQAEWVQNRAAYGGGVWDPSGDRPVSQVVELARTAGVSIIRYASGNYRLENVVNTYDRDGRLIERSVKYGLDEFMKTTAEIGAEPVVIIPIHPIVVGGSDDDYGLRAAHAADIVEYLNSPNDENNPNGGTDWATIRAKNGHPAPYNVKYFEIGNEPYVRPNIGGVPRDGGSGVDFGWGYGTLYNRYSATMKAVDPSVKNGLYLLFRLNNRGNRYVLSVVQDNFDYIVIHKYYSQQEYADAGMNTEDYFKMNLSKPMLDTDIGLNKLMEEIEEITGKTDISFGISEYNCWHIDLCHEQLAGALLNAEVLRIFMKPENNLIMANHWQFVNSLHGMIQNINYITHDNHNSTSYKKRPNYYVYELYNKYFGEVLIDTQISGDIYDVRAYTNYMDSFQKEGISVSNTRIPYLSVNASKNTDNNEVYLMVINRNTQDTITPSIKLNNFMSADTADAWILNGPSLSADNEESIDVKITHKNFRIEDDAFSFTFEPHSLTAIEIKAKNDSVPSPPSLIIIRK